MAIADLTITNEELEGKKISDIVGDTLAGTPAENKQKFDDYSDVLKEKFNDLIDELVNLSPQSNVLEGVQVNGIDLTVSGKKVNIPLASTNNDGAMSTADKTKLDGLNRTSSVTSGGTGIPTSGAVHSAIQSVAGIASDTADFVVSYEENVSSSDNTHFWNVRKWNSGLCELWLVDGYETLDVQVPEKHGYAYYLGSIGSIKYPFRFSSAPHEYVTIHTCSNASGRYAYLGARGYNTESQRRTQTQLYDVMSPSWDGSSGAYNECAWKLEAYVVGDI